MRISSRAVGISTSSRTDSRNIRTRTVSNNSSSRSRRRGMGSRLLSKEGLGTGMVEVTARGLIEGRLGDRWDDMRCASRSVCIRDMSKYETRYDIARHPPCHNDADAPASQSSSALAKAKVPHDTFMSMTPSTPNSYSPPHASSEPPPATTTQTHRSARTARPLQKQKFHTTHPRQRDLSTPNSYSPPHASSEPPPASASAASPDRARPSPLSTVSPTISQHFIHISPRTRPPSNSVEKNN